MKTHLLLILACLCFAACNKDNASNVDITTSLTININLDGNSYDSISHTTGIIHNATLTTDRKGNAGRAMFFNKADSAYIDMGDLAGASFTGGRFTISCWAKVRDTTSSIAILSKRGQYGPFEYSLDNHIGHYQFKLDNWVPSGNNTVYGTDPLSAPCPIALDTWQHITYVADGDKVTVYINGKAGSETSVRNADRDFADTDAHFVIGNGGPYNENNFFDGAIDDVRLYNRPLSPAEVLALASE